MLSQGRIQDFQFGRGRRPSVQARFGKTYVKGRFGSGWGMALQIFVCVKSKLLMYKGDD